MNRIKNGPGITIGTLNSILASREKMNFNHRINVTGEQYRSMADWCEENCKGIWRGNNWGKAYFQFDDDADAMLFALKWGSG